MSDSAGATDIGWVDALLNTSFSGVNGCWVAYHQPSNSFYLASDDTSTWFGPLQAGQSSGTLSNSTCIIFSSGGGPSLSGNAFTLSIPVALKPVETATIFLWATDAAGAFSGYQTVGSFTVRPASASFTLRASPGSRTVTSGATGNAAYAVTVNGTGGFSGTVNFAFDINDTSPASYGMTGSFSPSSVPGGSSSTLTITTSATTPAGSYRLAVYGSAAGCNMCRVVLVALVVSGSGPPKVSVSPSSGGGSREIFVFTALLSSGNPANLNALINQFFTGSFACWIYFDFSSNLLSLASDDVSYWSVASLGSATTLQNSQCSVSAGAAVVRGNNALSVQVTFASPFAGPKTIWMRASDSAGLDSGYQVAGSWTVR